MRKLSVLVFALALATVACSGGGATGRKNDIAGPGSTSPTASGSAAASPSLSASPSAKATSKLPKPVGDGSRPGSTYRPPTGFPIPNLFTTAENTIGITKNTITLCTHAALSLAAVFRVNAADLNAYWEYVNNELGGVYGRKVVMTYADDNYGNNPGDVRTAYEECKGRNPFILLGGIGFDQIPQMRTFAEQGHDLYIHHIAREDFSKKYSFSYLPSVETAGRIAGQWVVKRHAGQVIGVVYRDSENWEPGHRTFKAELAKRGVTPVADLAVQKNSTVYSTQISTLKKRNAKVVFLWENALSAIEIIRQAKNQGFTPTWLIFPFNLITDTLKSAMTSPPVEGIAMWPAYRPGDTGGTYSPYADEIRFFERVHAKYASGKTDDVTWMTWLGWRQLHRLLLDCGPNCTRNRIVGLLQSGVHKPVFAGCNFDFTRNRHVGGFAVNIFEAYQSGSNAFWKNIEVCKTHF